MCLWRAEGACVLESPQFHTCLILSEFGVKGFVEECVFICVCVEGRGGGVGNEGEGRELGGTECKTLLFNGVMGGTVVRCLLFPLFLLNFSLCFLQSLSHPGIITSNELT